MTRSLEVHGNNEQSVLDFVLISDDLLPLVNSMVIDEDRKYSVTRIRKVKGKTVVTESDHNTLLVDMNLSWEKKRKVERSEIFNFKDEEGQVKFK